MEELCKLPTPGVDSPCYPAGEMQAHEVPTPVGPSNPFLLQERQAGLGERWVV